MSRLGVVTCHFNPCGYKAPVRNWWRWREQFPSDLPVVSVELSFDGRFHTESALKHVGTVENNAMWQKEALLNLALKHLPDDVDAVAWIDADIMFDGHGWIAEAEAALKKWNLVQLFSRVRFEGPDRESQFSNPGAVAGPGRAAGRGGNGRSTGTSPGGAWAAPRSVVEVGLYDRYVVGAGDRALLHASRGRFASRDPLRQPLGLRRDWLRWSPRWYDAVGEKVGFISQIVRHLHHGNRRNRQYGTRESILRRGRYDPETHVQYNADGVLEWTKAAPKALREDVRRFFLGRREDS